MMGVLESRRKLMATRLKVTLSYCHRPNLAATAEAKDLTAPTADKESGARSNPTAKSALIRKNTT